MLPKYGKATKINTMSQAIVESETKLLKHKLNDCSKNGNSISDRDISNIKLEIRKIAQIHKYNSDKKLRLTILRMRHLFVNVVDFAPNNKFKIFMAAALFINIRNNEVEDKKELLKNIINIPTPIESPEDSSYVTKFTQLKSHLVEKYLITVEKYNVEELKIDVNKLVEILTLEHDKMLELGNKKHALLFNKVILTIEALNHIGVLSNLKITKFINIPYGYKL